MPARRFRPSLIRFACAAGLATLAAGAASAQPGAVPVFDVWDVRLGEPLTQIPFHEIAFAACGTNGGPPSTVLDDLEQFTLCPAEPSGLHEVYFEYDDEQAYIARALRAEYEVLLAGTTMYAHPIIPSVLVDAAGIVRGIRIVTDDRIQVFSGGDVTPDDIRAAAYRLAVNLRGQFSRWNLACEALPPEEGQSPVGRNFVHDICRGADETLQQRLVIDAHFFRRLGQTGVDIFTQQVNRGAFESTTRFELVEAPYQPTTVHDIGVAP